MVEREMTFPVEPDELWEAITDPATVDEWFGGAVEWTLEPGADLVAQEDDGTRTGIITEVEPGRRFGFKWWKQDDPADFSEVIYEIRPVDGGTHLTVTERTLFPFTVISSRNDGSRWNVQDSVLFRIWASTVDTASPCIAASH